MRVVRGLAVGFLLFMSVPLGAQLPRWRELPPPAGQPTAQRDRTRVDKYVPGQLLVRFRRGVIKQASEAAHARIGASVLRQFRVVEDLQLLRLPEGMKVRDAERYYRGRADVLYAEPNYYRFAEQTPITPNDPRFAEMWSLRNTGQSSGTAGADIRAPQAWSVSTGSASVVVGITDTGVDYNHPDLAANIYRNEADCNTNRVDDDGNGYVDDCHGLDTANNDSDPMDDAGHGTHVAGTIGAVGNNGVGVVGINWQVRIIACKFLGSNGSGSDADAIDCLQYFATMKDRGVNLVATNNSWGGGGFSQALKDAIDAHRRRGILFIAAAGNAATDTDMVSFYPANYDLANIITVAATDRNDRLASFSNFGRHAVHVAAPGAEILSTVPGALYADQYLVASGTSMAAPHVTGVAALLKAQDPSRDWKILKNLIMAGGDVVEGAAKTMSQRRLNAYGAMTCNNVVVQARLLPMEADAYLFPGDTLSLKYLNINCGAPNGTLQATVDGGPETIDFADDGIAPDLEAGDGVYVARRQWLTSEIGDHTLRFGDTVILAVHVVPPLSPYTFSTDVPFSYREIDGTDLHLGDDASALIRPPFPIQFGAQSFLTLNVNSNGNLTFFGPFVQWDNSALPTAGAPVLIAPLWDDTYGTVKWGVTGDAPNRELVVEWRDESSMGCYWSEYWPFHGRFQVVFFENSSDILFNYADVTLSRLHDPADDWWGCIWDANAGASATIGIQTGSNVANQFSVDSATLTNNSAIRWQLGEPAPSITRLLPFGAQAGSGPVSLNVLGRGFMPGAVARWNGEALPTTFTNAGDLSTTIAAAKLTSGGTVQVTVVNVPPNGSSESAPVTFHIYDSYPTPALTSVSPQQLPFRRPATITVAGTGFVPGSVVRWNGSNLATTPFNDAQLQATVPSNLMSLGAAEVTVSNPAPGGGTSNAVSVSVVYPKPAISIAPRVVGASAAPFSLELLGYDLAPNSVVRWNGNDRATTVSSNLHGLSVGILASDVESAGTAAVTAFTPAPGGGSSDPTTIQVVTPPANDNVQNATPIASFPFTLTQTALGASREPLDPPACGFGAYQTVWFTVTPPVGTFLKADAIGSNYMNDLSAWTGSPGSWTRLGCAANWALQGVGFPVDSPAPIYLMVSTQDPGWFNPDDPVLVLHVDLGSGFQLGLTPASNTVARGTAATFTATITPVSGSYDTPVNLECSVLGSDSMLPCSISQAQVTPGSVATSVTITVNTSSVAQLKTRGQPTPMLGLFALLPVVGLLAAGDLLRRRRIRLGVALMVALLAIQCGCGTGSTNGGGDRNPLPSITSMSPASATAGGTAFPLTVNGTHFVSRSVVRWNGSDRTTTYMSSSQLQASINAADIASAGSAAVTVYSPPPGGGTSAAQTFTINSGSGSAHKDYTVYVTAKSGTLTQSKSAALTVTW